MVSGAGRDQTPLPWSVCASFARVRWCLSHKYDPAAVRLADRHYNRRSPGTPQCAAPGANLILVSDCGRAVWITATPQYVWHAWPGAWLNTLFRSEAAGLASELIRDAVAATRAHFGQPSEFGMITFIDRRKVRPTMVRGAPVWGWSYRKAGFREVGETRKNKLLVLELLPTDMPAPAPARPRSMHGAPLFDPPAATGVSQV